MCECVSAIVCECQCVRVRESMSVCESMSMSVCVRERESMSMCVRVHADLRSKGLVQSQHESVLTIWSAVQCVCERVIE